MPATGTVSQLRGTVPFIPSTPLYIRVGEMTFHVGWVYEMK